MSISRIIRRNALKGLLVITLPLLVMSGVFVFTAHAATPVYVDSAVELSGDGLTPGTAFKTIQKGISAVDDGGTVNVAAGTYAENVTIDKSLTLRGDPGAQTEGIDDAGPSTSAPVLNGTDLSGSAITLSPGVTNVLIEGFEVHNYTDISDGSMGAITSWNTGASNITVQDNFLHDIGWNGVLVGSDDGTLQSNWTVKRNIVSGANYAGIELTNTTYSEVAYNVITIGAGIDSDPDDSGVGIEVAVRDHGTGVTAGTGVSVYDNEIDGDGVVPERAGINILSRAYQAESVALLDGVTIENNTVAGATRGIFVVAEERIGGNAEISSLSIESNTIAENDVGIEVGLQSGSPHENGTYDVAVVSNNIDGNDFGLDNTTGIEVNAANNWWNSINPDFPSIISGNVNYAPWCEDSVCSTTRSSNASINGADTGFLTIGGAITAAEPGDTINVGAGTYNERIVINKPLTLRGATYSVNKNGYTVPVDYAWDSNIESVINNPEPALSTSQVVDIVSDDVVFEGFIVQSLNALPSSANDHLLRLDATTGTADDGEVADNTLDNIVIRNNIIGPNTNLTSRNGTNGRMGLYFASPNYPADERGITNTLVTGNKIFDSNGNGNNVFVWGAAESYGSPANADYTGTVIEDNEIYGSHRSGVEIAGGVDNLVIRNNDIYGNSGLPSDDSANLKYGNGILIIRMDGDKTSVTAMGSASLIIEDNRIHDNEKNGIYFGPINSGHIISGNEIYGNGQDGIRVDLTEQYHGGSWPVYDNISNITAEKNKVYNNNVGAQVIGSPTNGFVLDAVNNWWGTVSSTEVAAKINGDVAYEPYCATSACTSIYAQIPATGSQLDDAEISVPDDATPTDTPSVTFLEETVLAEAGDGGTSTVTLPVGVTVTKTDGGNIDVTLLAAASTTPDSLSGFGTGIVVDSAFQWGIPNIGLTFSEPITLNIFVGTNFSGQVLNIVRSVSGSGDWTSDGIVSPATCAVFNGFCTFTATKASYYATTHVPPSSSGSGGGGGGGGGAAPVVTTPTPVATAPAVAVAAPVATPPAGEVLGVATFRFTKTLRYGSEGEDVTELQNRLTAEGVYSGPITGYFGPLTEAGVKAFQAKYDIEQAGVVGPLTRARLNSAVAAAAPAGQVLGAATTTLSETQIQSILNILVVFEVDQVTIDKVNAALRGQSVR